MSTKKIKILDNSMKVEISKRFRAFRTENKLSQKGLADQLGLRQSTIASIETAVTFPSLPITLFLVKKFNLSLNWLLTGDGEMFPRPRQTKDSSNFQLVPVIGSAACGGSGRILERDIETYKSFEISFLRNFKNPVLTRAKGDSMLPVIADGDLLLCDRDTYKRQHPDPKSIYLVNSPDRIDEVAIKVKKISFSGRTLTLIPLNPQFSPIAVDVDGKSILDIVLGRIVWIGRELN